MEDEIEGIKELIAGYLKNKKKTTLKELSEWLFLDESIICKAVCCLQDDGAVFMPDKTTVLHVEKF